MEFTLKEGVNLKLAAVAYESDTEVIKLLTDMGVFNLSKAAAERLRNDLVEFLGPAGKNDLLLQAMENGWTYYSPETGIIDMDAKDKQ